MKQLPQRRKQVIWKTVGGKTMLLDLENGTYFETDAVGLAIWIKCDGKSNMESISRKIAKQFSTSPEKVRKDLTAYLARLNDHNLLIRRKK